MEACNKEIVGWGEACNQEGYDEVVVNLEEADCRHHPLEGVPGRGEHGNHSKDTHAWCKVTVMERIY